MNIDSLEWDGKMLHDFGIKRESLANIKKSSSDSFGEI